MQVVSDLVNLECSAFDSIFIVNSLLLCREIYDQLMRKCIDNCSEKLICNRDTVSK